MTTRTRIIGALAVLLGLTGVPAGRSFAQEPASRCLAVAQTAPGVVPVNYIPVQDGMTRPQSAEVAIRFMGHSTFMITTPEGVTIATDYNGYLGGATPRVATMYQAQRSHFTNSPDPAIEFVLRGWNPEGGPAKHNLQVDDVLVRNVPTDLRGFGGNVRIPDGNSIFIFEVGGLCIGHLGHLQQLLGSEDLSWIGQLDIVMVPVDGGYTMDQDAMVQTLQVLKARLILPMHYFGQSTLSRFLARLDEEFEVEMSDSPEIRVSVATLPASPKVLVLPGY